MFLVTGANGQLGSELRQILGDRALYVDREELDITNEDTVRAFFEAQSFDFIINCAAYTAVDKAEEEAKTAEKVNTLGPALLARYGRRIIQISTDYVFDGTGHLPYREKDEPHPISVYGKTKQAGEKAVFEEADTAVVIRTAWLYSTVGNNFVKTMRRLGAEKESIGVVFDQVGTPTYAADLAAVIVGMLPQIAPSIKEIYHYSNEGVASWYDFAVAIMEESALNCSVLPIESWEFPTRAVRPAYSVLNKAKIKKDFGISIPHWKEGLKRCLQKMKEERL